MYTNDCLVLLHFFTAAQALTDPPTWTLFDSFDALPGSTVYSDPENGTCGIEKETFVIANGRERYRCKTQCPYSHYRDITENEIIDHNIRNLGKIGCSPTDEDEPCHIAVPSQQMYTQQTFSLWVKRDIGSRVGTIIDRGGDTPDEGDWSLEIRNDSLIVQRQSRPPAISTNWKVPDGKWVHIVLRFVVYLEDSRTGSIFINGEYKPPSFGIGMVRNRNKTLSFGVPLDIQVNTSGCHLNTIPECQRIGYSALVTMKGLNQTQIIEDLFNETSPRYLYTCQWERDKLTLFGCAWYTPPCHIQGGDVTILPPCKSFCLEYVAACGDLHGVHGTNKSCDLLPDGESPGVCVGLNYLPQYGMFRGQIKDVKQYNVFLSDREVAALYLGYLPEIQPMTECVCRFAFASIVDPVDSTLCTSETAKFWALQRLPVDLHGPELTIDADNTTFWASQPGHNPVSLVYQIKPRSTKSIQALGASLLLDMRRAMVPDIKLYLQQSGRAHWRHIYSFNNNCSYLSTSYLQYCLPQKRNLETHYVIEVDFLYDNPQYNPERQTLGSLYANNFQFTAAKLEFTYPSDTYNENDHTVVFDFKVHARELPPEECVCDPDGAFVDPPICDSPGQCRCRKGAGDPSLAGKRCAPYISDIKPLYGPESGGTEVRVHGGFFGNYKLHNGVKHFSVIRAHLDISGVEFNITFSNETFIRLLTPRVNTTDQPVLGVKDTVLITLISGTVINSTYSFEYRKDPVVYSIHPLTSFLSGGVEQTIIGDYLDSVAIPLLDVTLIYNGHNYPSSKSVCSVKNSTCMACPSPIFPDLPFDLSKRKRDVAHLESSGILAAVRSPLPWMTRPKRSSIDLGIDFGGIKDAFSDANIDVDGIQDAFSDANFDVDGIKEAIVKANIDTDLITDTLSEANIDLNLDKIKELLSDHEQGKTLQQTSSRVINRDYRQFYVGLTLDGVPTYTNLTEVLPEYGIIKMYQDPVIHIFDPETREFKPSESAYMVIGGERMNWAVDMADYSVTIGDELCEVVDLASNALTCKAPEEEPGGRFAKDGNQRVITQVGNIRIINGYINYPSGKLDKPAVLAAIIFAIVIPVLLILAVVLYKKWRHYQYNSIVEKISKGGKEYVVGPGAPVTLLDLLETGLRVIVESCLLNENSLDVKGDLGQGNFGKVYEGHVENRVGVRVQVAIKTVKDQGPTLHETSEFLEEATIMKDFEHQNVLSLVGVIIRENRPYVCLPIMHHGDLKKYISNPKIQFSVRTLLGYGHQVSSGMAYLASLKFVHRDLAARNCMIDNEEVVKIADFGLARDIHEKDYYRIADQTRPLPVKWMALESLESHVFSTKSDVWSYGVVLWELLTRGTKPYPDVDNLNIKRFLQHGRRLEKPLHCPQAVYDIMLRCWEKSPNHRPTFQELESKLGVLLGLNVQDNISNNGDQGDNGAQDSQPRYASVQQQRASKPADKILADDKPYVNLVPVAGPEGYLPIDGSEGITDSKKEGDARTMQSQMSYLEPTGDEGIQVQFEDGTKVSFKQITNSSKLPIHQT